MGIIPPKPNPANLAFAKMYVSSNVKSKYSPGASNKTKDNSNTIMALDLLLNFGNVKPVHDNKCSFFLALKNHHNSGIREKRINCTTEFIMVCINIKISSYQGGLVK